MLETEYELPSPGYLPLSLLEAKEDADIEREFKQIAEPLQSMLLWLIDLVVEVHSHFVSVFSSRFSQFRMMFMCFFGRSI